MQQLVNLAHFSHSYDDSITVKAIFSPLGFGGMNAPKPLCSYRSKPVISYALTFRHLPNLPWAQ